MKYKTLIRKSDGQWMKLWNPTFVGMIGKVLEISDSPVNWNNIDIEGIKKRFPTYVNWSLYDLIEVAIIPVSDIPSDEKIKEQCPHTNDLKDIWNDAIEWYKSQIFK